MIRVYLLPVTTIDGAEQVAGIDFIHDALLECTEDPDTRKLIMDTTDAEHAGLLATGAVPAVASQEDVAMYHTEVVITPPDPDIERARVLLASSPAVITQPEMWELMRIFGHLHGIVS
ncbi:hypothetical protein ES705_21349 [subsurface metagenome]